MSDHKLILIEKARKVLRGEQLPAAELGKLRRELEANDQFGYAAEILLRKMKYDEERNQSVSTREYQDLARYLYKDTSLPAVLKFEKALQRLHVNLELDQSEDYETLGLAGAVYKRKWQYDHQFRNLVLSRYYYGKGFEYWKRNLDQQPKDPDAGYTAINYAYICELMAVDKLAETGQVTGWSEEIAADLETALDTRELLVKLLPERYGAEPESWVLATLAEAFFGLGRYSEAQVYIKKYLERKTQPWELRSFNQQLVSLACLQMSCKQTPGGESLSDVLKAFRGRVGIADINSCLDLFQLPGKSNNRELRQEGKYGLALSGGGFRASLFHIGVLAALAEQDRLKDLEVLSCVSGGSIVGAFYYLKLKVLFEAKTDRQIDKYDYIRLVGEIEQEFLKGVQQNLRMRIFGNLIKNIRMAFDTGYSRTHRLGELYEMHLYRDILLKRDKDLNPDGRYDALLKRNKDQLFMSDLYINPLLEEGETFAFGTDNWKRKNRIPQLVLNATSVNTAHNWQFTASWMGEPPGNIQPDIDMKPRLRRMYYPDAPEPFRKFRLGYAVGASSCVPVMFHPMPMKGLYPDIDLQLVDGGLHDNQGIAALLEQECRNLFISDASGQLPTQSGSIKNEASVFYRSDSILQERLRELQFLDVRERSNTLQLDSVCTVHLKSGLQRDPENWTDCTEPTRTVYLEAAENRHNDLTNYGVLRQVQQHLSELRTDLDAFTEAEAYALMYSGWCQVRTQQQVTDMPAQWQFLQAADCLTMPVPARKISPHLEAGKNLFFKLWYVSPVIRYSLITIGILVGLLLLRYTAMHWDSNCTLLDLSLTIRTVAVLVGLYLLGMVSELLAKVLNYKGYLKRQLITLIVAMAGFVVCWFYVTFLNPIYIRSGKLSRFS